MLQTTNIAIVDMCSVGGGGAKKLKLCFDKEHDYRNNSTTGQGSAAAFIPTFMMSSSEKLPIFNNFWRISEPKPEFKEPKPKPMFKEKSVKKDTCLENFRPKRTPIWAEPSTYHVPPTGGPLKVTVNVCDTKFDLRSLKAKLLTESR